MTRKLEPPKGMTDRLKAADARLGKAQTEYKYAERELSQALNNRARAVAAISHWYLHHSDRRPR